MAISSLGAVRKLTGKRLAVTNQNFTLANTYYTVHSVTGTGQIRIININYSGLGSSANNTYRLTIDGNVISTVTTVGSSLNVNLGLDRTSLSETPLTISFKNSFLFEGQTSNYNGVGVFNSVCIYDVEQ